MEHIKLGHAYNNLVSEVSLSFISTMTRVPIDEVSISMKAFRKYLPDEFTLTPDMLLGWVIRERFETKELGKVQKYKKLQDVLDLRPETKISLIVENVMNITVFEEEHKPSNSLVLFAYWDKQKGTMMIYYPAEGPKEFNPFKSESDCFLAVSRMHILPSVHLSHNRLSKLAGLHFFDGNAFFGTGSSYSEALAIALLDFAVRG